MAGFRYVTLTGSVGRDGKNLPADVTSVQEIINAHLPPGLTELKVDGVSGTKTETAIEMVERKYIHAREPDRRIDPHGPTLRALNFATKTVVPTTAASQAELDKMFQQLRFPTHTDPRLPTAQGWPATPQLNALQVKPGKTANVQTPSAPPTPPSTAGGTNTGRKDARVHWHEPPAGTAPPPEVIAAAKLSMARWGAPASITLAQWTKESTWGHAIPRGSRNYFGIKAGKGEPYVKAWTTEIVNHLPVRKLLNFKVFASDAECFDAHGKLLAHHPAYAAARTHLNDPDAYAWGLQGHYATDEQYAKDLVKRMHVYNLYQYDH